MAIAGEQIAAALVPFWPGIDVKQVVPVMGGYWAEILRLRLTGAPDGIPDDVVLRVMPDDEMGAKELVVHAAAAELGVPTPRIYLSAPAGGPLVGSWALMDFAPGPPLIGDLHIGAAVRGLPELLRRLPAQLADTMASIHRVDPAPVRERVRVAAPTVAFDIDALCQRLQAGAVERGRRDLQDAMGRLTEQRPGTSASVLCHGDLHPLNLLGDGGDITVLDWTGAIIAPPAYDVAFTWLLLRHPPLPVPAMLRPLVAAGGATLSRRFLRRYLQASPGADLSDVGWFLALHSARMLIDLARWQRTGDPRAASHPYRIVAPRAARFLRRASGVQLPAT